MKPASSSRQRWRLTKEAFDRLLAVLDPNPDRAGERYLQTREKLNTFFRCNGLLASEDLVDETLDRVARRLGEVEILNFMAFIRGVARVVALEAHKKDQRDISLEAIPRPFWDRGQSDEATFDEKLSPEYRRCLEKCFKTLPPEHEYLIREYYRYEGAQSIDRKQSLATEFGLNAGALRLKAFRIRSRLQGCVLACVQNSRGVTKGHLRH